MNSERTGFLTEAVAFTLSLMINGASLFWIDHAVAIHDGIMARQAQVARMFRKKEDALQFEFVEAPHKASAQKPQSSRKISNRDAVNQDLSKDKSKAGELPQAHLAGLSEQLEQHQMSASQAPSLASKPAPESHARPKSSAVSGTEPQKPQAETKPLEKPVEQPKSEARVNEAPPKEPQAQFSKPSPESHASPASSPKPAIPGFPGNDKIRTQETSRFKSVGAKLYGMTSFEATGSGMGVYMKNLKEKIWLQWFPYMAFKYPVDFKTADAAIRFTIDKTGQVKDVKVAESDGSSLFAMFCAEAVQRASGFGPLPEEIRALIGKDELEITFGFHYR